MTDEIPSPRRWDPIVKLTHWGLVAAVIANALVTEEGSGWHIWVGYALAGLLALRLLWGLIGPPEARFSAFPPSPSRALQHLGDIHRGDVTPHRSHNPLGALMVYTIWSCLAVIIVSGIAMSGPPPADPSVPRHHENQGVAGRPAAVDAANEDEDEDEHAEAAGAMRGEVAAAAGEGDEREEGVMEEVHEVAVTLLYLLIALHLAGVLFETRRSGRQIVGAMLPGGNRPTS